MKQKICYGDIFCIRTIITITRILAFIAEAKINSCYILKVFLN